MLKIPFPAKFTFILVVSLLLTACSPSSKREFQIQIENDLSLLIRDLSQVHESKELSLKSRKLKRRFKKITESLMAYTSYLEKHPEINHDVSEKLQDLSQELRRVLDTIYSFDGSRDIMEELQKDSYLRLNLYQNSRKGDRINLYTSPKRVLNE